MPTTAVCQSMILLGFPCSHANAACMGRLPARAVTREKAVVRALDEDIPMFFKGSRIAERVCQPCSRYSTEWRKSPRAGAVGPAAARARAAIMAGISLARRYPRPTSSIVPTRLRTM